MHHVVETAANVLAVVAFDDRVPVAVGAGLAPARPCGMHGAVETAANILLTSRSTIVFALAIEGQLRLARCVVTGRGGRPQGPPLRREERFELPTLDSS